MSINNRLGKFSYADIYRTLLISLFFAFYAVVSFGAGVNAHYKYAPYLFALSFLSVFVSGGKRILIRHLYLLKPLLVFSVVTFVYSVNYLRFIHPLCGYLEYVTYSLLPFVTTFAIFTYASQGRREFNFILLANVLFFVVAIYRFFHEFAAMRYFGALFGQNNAFYQVLFTLPILFLINNKSLNIISLFASLVICLLSLKRSAFIVMLLITIIYLYKEVLLDKKSRIRGLLIILIVIYISSWIVDYSVLFHSISVTQSRMENLATDGASGRFSIAQRFFRADFQDVNLFLGRGFMGYHDKYPSLIASHNDIIEIYYSYGIFGLLCLLVFTARFIKETVIINKSNSELSLPYLSAFIIYISYMFAAGCFTFVNLTLGFFSFIALSQAKKVV